jgi:hypothetical protein
MNREQTVVCHFSTTDGTSNISHTATIGMYSTVCVSYRDGQTTHTRVV